MEYDVAVIGGGPAGMMAAGRAAELGAKVVLLEKNSGLGKKLLITGGGRCNIFNAEEDVRALTEKYGKKGKVLFSAFSRFGMPDCREFFESRGLKIKVEAEKRAFPFTEKAEDVQKTMVKYLKAGGVEVITDCMVIGFRKSNGLITRIVHDSGEIVAKHYILATGGKSHPETGSTGEGFQWLTSLGHTVIEPEPSLVPVILRNPWVKDVAGISLKGVKLTIVSGGKKLDSNVGKMLFTHDGLSGPLVLNMSKRVGECLKSGPVTLSLDLFPKLDLGALDKKMLEVFETGKNKMIKNYVGDLVQPRLGHVLLTLAGIDPATPLHQLTREGRLEFARFLKDMPMSVSGLKGEEDAIVTGGGVSLKEVDFATMKSKIIKNLSLAGDVLDFDRPSGGFSLQICWTTGWIAGTNAV